MRNIHSQLGNFVSSNVYGYNELLVSKIFLSKWTSYTIFSNIHLSIIENMEATSEIGLKEFTFHSASTAEVIPNGGTNTVEILNSVLLVIQKSAYSYKFFV